ncbi:polyprenyl synthetase family protein [Allostreptomyces psammosilenae]|uniref:Geranylgeranyl diphosphate synthase type I n=1 Tax=Allostreptomyces psammosilenae TaxID=1892865 RepID=A0A852ZXJ4_9ACTN|nr:polyprenyl synthetase family protein [Allostreptomyces psammosilenae]NYI07066.1 geranylgeranyl diphosphate synthase type I [Allostreptomyces psammosilenae]
MTAAALSSRHPLDEEHLRDRVGSALAAFLAHQDSVLADIAESLLPVAEAVREFLLDGGKRLRPGFCYWGWRGAGGADCDEAVAAAACLELLQASALIHDDLMDSSDTRRGRPSVHRHFEGLHRAGGWHGSAEGFGEAAAVLLGDLCLVWTDELYFSSGLPAESLLRARPHLDLMRTELMAGQYLDVLEQAVGGGSVERAGRVLRYKSAKYTVERPLQVGAVLAGAGKDLLEAYSAFGLPLGEAFQLRDDVLGVFGDPSQTGKPAGDDLREGKRTLLVALAEQEGTARDARLVTELLGDPALDAAGVATLQEVIRRSGALEEVERTIQRLTDQALDALDEADVLPRAREVLRRLAEVATRRSS